MLVQGEKKTSILTVAAYSCFLHQCHSTEALALVSHVSQGKLFRMAPGWKTRSSQLSSSPYNSEDDANRWWSGEDDNNDVDWEEMLQKRQNPDAWSSYESSQDEALGSLVTTNSTSSTELDESEVWLNTLQSISAQEVEFNLKENERADKARQMQEWGFTSQAIQGALGVAVDDTFERESDEAEAALIDEFRKSNFGMVTIDDDVDLKTVESHAKVDIDEETGEPVRSQMVYVDEHTCIGCTNCAMIAPSTFFMEDWLGRARVFQQWGDDDETIKVAIETCPVDCIHYVPYEELVSLEVRRRDQNINFKAGLVNKAGDGHRVGGAVTFTDAPKISGNMRSRCNNCPSGELIKDEFPPW